MYQSTSWIICIDSGCPWPSIWVIAVTHGNEPVGIHVHEKLKKLHLNKWKLYLIRSNEQSYERWVRYIDVNLNRIFDWDFRWTYEYKRAQELLPILDSLDIAIDLHSVSYENHSMVFCDLADLLYIKSIINVDYFVADKAFSKKWALVSCITNKWKIWFWVECGQHESLLSIDIWYKSVMNLLIKEGMIDGEFFKMNAKSEEFTIKYEIKSDTQKLQFTRQYKQFEKLEANELFAKSENWEVTFFAKTNEYIGLMTPNDKILIWDWIWFIFEKLNYWH